MKFQKISQLLISALLPMVLPALALGAPQSACSPPDQSWNAGSYKVMTNYWNQSTCPGTECVTLDNSTGNFGVTEMTASCSSVAAYPAIYYGCHYGNCSTGTNLPMQVSSLNCVLTNWTVTTTNSGVWDAAYDIWFCTGGAGSCTSGYDGAELMIWFDYLGASPLGSQIATNVSLGGRTWNVWEGRITSTTSWNVISYQATTKFDSVSNLDIKAFINDAVSRGYIQTAWYLHAVEAGIEITKGGVPFTSSGFSVTVNGGCGTPVPTPTPTATACIKLFNSCNSATENGTWSGVNATRTFITSGYPAGALTDAGPALMKVAAGATTNAWNNGLFNLSGFSPDPFTGWAQLSLDLYVDAGVTALWGGFHSLSLIADSSANSLYSVAISSTNPTLSFGEQSVTFNLDYPASITSSMLLSNLYFVLNAQNPVTAGNFYVDNIRLIANCGLPTATPTPTVTSTPCASLFNGCETLTDNGTWDGANATRSIVTSSTGAPAGFPTQGSGCMKVQVTTPSGYNNGLFNLSGFTPTDFYGTTRISLDFYADSALVGGAYDQLLLFADSAPSSIYFQGLSSTVPNVAAGKQTLVWTIDDKAPGGGASSITGTMPITKLYFVYNTAVTTATGNFYVDNIQLLHDGCTPTHTPVPTATFTWTFTNTFTPSPTRTPTSTFTPTFTNTLTSSPSNTFTFTNTPANTNTFTPTATSTATNTATSTYTFTRTNTPTNTVTNTLTATPSSTPTGTFTNTLSPTPTSTNTLANTATFTSTPTHTATFTLTYTPTNTATRTFTATNTNTSTNTSSPTPTVTFTFTNTATNTSTFTNSFTNTSTNTLSATPSATPTASPSTTPTPTKTLTPTNTNTATNTRTFTNTFTPAITYTSTNTPTGTLIPTNTPTVTYTPTNTMSPTPTSTFTRTSTNTPTPTNTSTPTFTDTSTFTSAATSTSTSTTTFTATRTNTNTSTFTNTATASPSATATADPSATPTNTATSTATSTNTSTFTSTATPTPTFTTTSTSTKTSTPTLTHTSTNTYTSTVTPTATNTPTGTLSPTNTPTMTYTPTNTLSPTLTPTFTDSTTPTPSAALTASPTASSTPTLTSTPSWTPSASPTFTKTNTPVSPTATPTNTNAATSTSTPTDTPTPTAPATPTHTNTPTASSTNTFTFTLSATPSPTFSATASHTLTASPTASQTPTASSTPTGTPSSTPTGTPTASLTPTGTLSYTSTFSPTATPTTTPTFTSSFTPTFTPNGSTSATPTLTTGSPLPTPNLTPVVYPNPVSGDTIKVLPPPYQGIQNVEAEIFTSAFRKVQDTTFYSVPSGVAVTVELNDRWGRPLANGLYYVVVIVDGHRSIAKLLILR